MKANAIRFNKYHVTDGNRKARVRYSLDSRIDKRSCVTIYAKDYTSELGNLFSDDCSNGTDMMTDYYEKDRVVLFEDHPQYQTARARVEAFAK